MHCNGKASAQMTFGLEQGRHRDVGWSKQNGVKLLVPTNGPMVPFALRK